MDVDMIGMGPFIPHSDTPMGRLGAGFIPSEEERLELSLRMIALARIILKDVNITASTAMQTLDPDGRIKAILAGANVFMPNMTPEENAKNYFLYDNKPLSTDQSASASPRSKDMPETLCQQASFFAHSPTLEEPAGVSSSASCTIIARAPLCRTALATPSCAIRYRCSAARPSKTRPG